jgi:hypothetical protein
MKASYKELPRLSYQKVIKMRHSLYYGYQSDSCVLNFFYKITYSVCMILTFYMDYTVRPSS